MRRTNPFGFWDFLSGRAVTEVGAVRERPTLKIPHVRLPGGFEINPIRGNDLLIGAALVGAGYLICRLTNR